MHDFLRQPCHTHKEKANEHHEERTEHVPCVFSVGVTSYLFFCFLLHILEERSQNKNGGILALPYLPKSKKTDNWDQVDLEENILWYFQAFVPSLAAPLGYTCCHTSSLVPSSAFKIQWRLNAWVLWAILPRRGRKKRSSVRGTMSKESGYAEDSGQKRWGGETVREARSGGRQYCHVRDNGRWRQNTKERNRTQLQGTRPVVRERIERASLARRRWCQWGQGAKEARGDRRVVSRV